MEKSLKYFTPGERGIVKHVVGKGPVRRRLFDMGVMPGVEIRMKKEAPLGDPIEITLRGYELSLRKSEAEHIIMEVGEDIEVLKERFKERQKMRGCGYGCGFGAGATCNRDDQTCICLENEATQSMEASETNSKELDILDDTVMHTDLQCASPLLKKRRRHGRHHRHHKDK